MATPGGSRLILDPSALNGHAGQVRSLSSPFKLNGGVGGACLSCVPVRLCRAGIFDLDPRGLEGSSSHRQNNR